MARMRDLYRKDPSGAVRCGVPHHSRAGGVSTWPLAFMVLAAKMPLKHRPGLHARGQLHPKVRKELGEPCIIHFEIRVRRKCTEFGLHDVLW